MSGVERVGPTVELPGRAELRGHGDGSLGTAEDSPEGRSPARSSGLVPIAHGVAKALQHVNERQLEDAYGVLVGEDRDEAVTILMNEALAVAGTDPCKALQHFGRAIILLADDPVRVHQVRHVLSAAGGRGS